MQAIAMDASGAAIIAVIVSHPDPTPRITIADTTIETRA
jgi:hypothetical protein